MAMKWNEFITKKYIEWRGDAYGREKSITEFASYIGVAQSTLSGWMKADSHVPKDKRLIFELAQKLGPEVLEILGQDGPIQFTSLLFNFVLDVQTELSNQGIDPDDPAHENRAMEVIKRVAEERSKYQE